MKKKNKRFIKFLMLSILSVGTIFSLSACGENKEEEKIKSAEERALELQDDAKDAVDKVNEDTNQVNQSIEDIEE